MRSLSTAQEEIKNFCEKREVFELLHFVKAAQMPFILRYGLLTNAILRNAGGTIEDQSRIDRNADHVCLSIDFPNYKLFYKHRMENTRETWCILSISKSLIWERPCIFFPSNAARNNGRYGKRGLTGIQAIYAASIGGIERSPLIKDSLPTEPQAEVLVPDPVTPEEIKKCISAIQQRQESMKALSSMPANRYKSEKTCFFLEKIGIHGSACLAQKRNPKATIGSNK